VILNVQACPQRRNRHPPQRSTPLGAEVCEGEVTVTDPRHPLFGRSLKLVGVACVPGHIRQCHVELFRFGRHLEVQQHVVVIAFSQHLLGVVLVGGPVVLVTVPVNKSPDFVHYVVGRLETPCPTMGKVKIAQTLARGLSSVAPLRGRWGVLKRPSYRYSSGCVPRHFGCLNALDHNT
jgi:hypothetical protein